MLVRIRHRIYTRGDVEPLLHVASGGLVYFVTVLVSPTEAAWGQGPRWMVHGNITAPRARET